MNPIIHSLTISRFGGPEVLLWKETHPRPIGQKEVRVQVKAAGVNFADLMMRMGMYPEAPKPPFVPGYEIAGQIIEVGDQVQSLQKGDRVLGGTRFGGYTEEIILPESQLRKIPKSLDYAQAAAIPVNFLTAWVALQDMARVRKGDRVLIESAAGGVGTAAVQIAAQEGATVVGLVGSREKVEAVKNLGASEVMTYAEWEELKDSKKDSFQIILDSRGGASLKRCFKRLAPCGRVITFGVSDMVSGPRRSISHLLSVALRTAFFTPFQLMMANKGVFGLNMLQLMDPDPTSIASAMVSNALDQILVRFESGVYQVIVGKTFSLSEGGKAHSYLQSRSNVGKVILTTSP